MATAEQWTTYVGLVLMLALTPGPTMLMIAAASLEGGAGAGRLMATGAAVGYLPHLLGAGLGVGALLYRFPEATDALRLAGTPYLLWLAWRTLSRTASAPVPGGGPDARAGARGRVVEGFLVSALNPLTLGFYLAVVPRFVNADGDGTAAAIATLGLTHMVIVYAINLSIAQLAGGLGGRSCPGAARRLYAWLGSRPRALLAAPPLCLAVGMQLFGSHAGR